MSDDVMAGVDVATEAAPAEDMPSMDETLASTLADIRARDTEGDAERSASNRGPDGRFTASEAATDTSTTEDASVADTEAEPAADAPVVSERPAPETWRAEAKTKWAELPDWAKDEIEKREADVLNGFKARDEHSHFGRSMQQIISPYLPLIQSQGGTAEGAVQSLLNTAYVLHQGTPAQKTAAVRDMIRQFGIDLGAMQAESADDVDPKVRPVLDRVAQLEQRLESQRTQEYHSLVQSAQAELAEWKAKESPKYFDQVQHDMVNLIQSGQARSYADAYTKACRLNDGVFSAMQAEQLATAEKKRLDDVAKKAKEAKRTAHVRTTPSPVLPKAGATIDDTLRQTLAEIRARA